MTDAATCERCGALALCERVDDVSVCAACAAPVGRVDRHEALRLFVPAPEPMPGQEGWEL